MIHDIKLLYKDNIGLKSLENGYIEITLPYLDPYNDYLQLYINRLGNGYIITDDGYTLNELSYSNFDLKLKRYQEFLHNTLFKFGVTLDNTQLTIYAESENLSIKINDLIQAILTLDDMSEHDAQEHYKSGSCLLKNDD